MKDQIKLLAEKINKTKGQVLTEEATKTAFIIPLLRILGYDDSDPLEVVPEYGADFADKKAKKVDYAIMQDGKALILIECKHWEEKLNVGHEAQLVQYFHAARAKIGILTNGIIYQFYAAIDEANYMDKNPFLEFDVTHVKDKEINELKKYRKQDDFDLETIIERAKELKYMAEIKGNIQKEMSDPSEWFVRGVATDVFQGRFTEKMLDYFTALTKNSFSEILNDIRSEMADKLKAMSVAAPEPEAPTEPENQIVTTEEEMEGFYTVRAALRHAVNMDRISFKDTASYFGILLDGNIRRTICRLYFNGTKKYVSTFDENKKEIRHEFTKMDDIFKIADAMIQTIQNYDNPDKAAKPNEASGPDSSTDAVS